MVVCVPWEKHRYLSHCPDDSDSFLDLKALENYAIEYGLVRKEDTACNRICQRVIKFKGKI